jgi:UDP-N-acetyl-D-mannosaminuronic acid dehydrogenase
VGCDIAGARVLVLGYAYLEDSDDTRNSPSETLVARLKYLGAQVVIHDPYVPEYQGDVYEAAQGCDAAVFMVRHKQYLELDWRKLKEVMRSPVLVDGRHVLDENKGSPEGFLLYRIGA